jgi:nitroimidazol reductase NimA-like FMN-containing flavoprotein (pyridoxamine 5'-phosphate oxidase superfamily)
MLIQEMTVAECHEFLARRDLGRLGCAHENEPYVVPIHFAYEPNRLYGFTTLGQKVEWMRANPRVCVEVDEVIHNRRWSSVILSGEYHELPNETAYAREREHAYKLLENRFLWWETALASEQPRHASHPAPTILYCIHVSRLSGRRAMADAFDSAQPQQDDHFS